MVATEGLGGPPFRGNVRCYLSVNAWDAVSFLGGKQCRWWKSCVQRADPSDDSEQRGGFFQPSAAQRLHVGSPVGGAMNALPRVGAKGEQHHIKESLCRVAHSVIRVKFDKSHERKCVDLLVRVGVEFAESPGKFSFNPRCDPLSTLLGMLHYTPQ